jgi:hypothetical protein
MLKISAKSKQLPQLGLKGIYTLKLNRVHSTVVHYTYRFKEFTLQLDIIHIQIQRVHYANRQHTYTFNGTTLLLDSIHIQIQRIHSAIWMYSPTLRCLLYSTIVFTIQLYNITLQLDNSYSTQADSSCSAALQITIISWSWRIHFTAQQYTLNRLSMFTLQIEQFSFLCLTMPDWRG